MARAHRRRMSAARGRRNCRSPLVVIVACRHLPIPRRTLAGTALRIYASCGLPVSQRTHVILCSDRQIRRLNRKFRHADRATDVLSFNYDEPDLLGEIYISLERAAVQARRYSHAYTDEVQRLLVHGLMHLLGYDHERPEDRRRMEAAEARYCRV